MGRSHTDVVDLLTDQHRQIRRAFRKAAMPGSSRPRAFNELVRLLAVHEAGEEAHVHPLVRHAMPGGKAMAAARRQEEKQAKKLLTTLWKAEPKSSGFPGYAKYLGMLLALRRAVLAHAAREERDEFTALRQAVGSPRRRLLSWEVRATQAMAPTRPHPMVNNEVANKLATPLFGPLDRMLDRVTAMRRDHGHARTNGSAGQLRRLGNLGNLNGRLVMVSTVGSGMARSAGHSLSYGVNRIRGRGQVSSHVQAMRRS